MAADGTQTPFLTPEPERTVSPQTWIIAAVAVLVIVAVAAIATLRRAPANTGAALAPDAYAASLPITNISMSEATNGTGGKATYVDGVIGNTGTKTLTGAEVQVTFSTSDGTAPHRETVPVAVVRTRVPYVDLQPLSADPIKPGDHRDFRLIFESVPANWDVQPPAIQVVRTELR
ncbi:hypothetical protein Terro_3252 [Terriglobus roseus DSM 18391]|uniref:DUF2393 domain-containing protein n=1 Tax=Terriglobus roseus (strain DSM 18391 / NRRL B-41598 / KBS 63) TaxID=926566 RepID=I3ZJQ2_TERRK|nr:DUF2393 family protein [Terriglobus roseus]AFL89470.1 hypothetical protein Terro_3252 [Terriglobus roseus DSM 18391]